MKTIPCLFAIAGLSLAFSPGSRAQDAPTRPLQDQPSTETQPSPSAAKETPSPTASLESNPESHEAPSPTPGKSPTKAKKPAKTKKTAAKTEKTTAKPAATPAKSPAKPAEKAAAKAERTAAAETTGRAGSSSADATKLKAMEKEWEASFNDPAVIEKSLADDFVGTSPDGKLVTKKSLLREAKKSKAAPPITSAYRLDVHFYGPDVAVVVGSAKETIKNKAGENVEYNYRFTDTWVERNGQWQCVASQAVLLPRR
ncbi:MAG: nuclear transport factor 2 family protein [Verrucomicrobiota bacterium]|nr:nuclear transport factor 2 family protein [Verrucomicrobiota bacterium]